MTGKITCDDIRRGVKAHSNPNDPMCVGQVDTQLLKLVYKDFKPRPEGTATHRVFVANQSGFDVNQVQTGKRSKMPADMVIPAGQESPRLSHGDIVLAYLPTPTLGQVDRKTLELQGATGVNFLTPHGRQIKPSVMIRNALDSIWVERHGVGKVWRTENGIGQHTLRAALSTHEVHYPEIDARVVANLAPDVNHVDIYRPANSRTPVRFSLDEYTNFEGGNMKEFVKAKTEEMKRNRFESAVRHVSERFKTGLSTARKVVVVVEAELEGREFSPTPSRTDAANGVETSVAAQVLSRQIEVQAAIQWLECDWSQRVESPSIPSPIVLSPFPPPPKILVDDFRQEIECAITNCLDNGVTYHGLREAADLKGVLEGSIRHGDDIHTNACETLCWIHGEMRSRRLGDLKSELAKENEVAVLKGQKISSSKAFVAPPASVKDVQQHTGRER